MSEVLKIKNIEKYYGNKGNIVKAIDNVSSGNIYLDGKDLTEINQKNIAKFRRGNLGFIFQDFNLLDTLT